MLNFTIVLLFILIIFGLLWLLIDMARNRQRDIAEAQIEILVEAQVRICDLPDKAPMAHLIDIQNDLEEILE